MTATMEALARDLYEDRVPQAWIDISSPTLMSLGMVGNLQRKIEMLQDWVQNPTGPYCTWLSGLSNPVAFLTAIMQTAAEAEGLELDKLGIRTDVLKRTPNDIDAPSREGNYIHGLFLEGASLGCERCMR